MTDDFEPRFQPLAHVANTVELPEASAVRTRGEQRARRRRVTIAGCTVVILVAAVVAPLALLLPGRASHNLRPATGPVPTTTAPTTTLPLSTSSGVRSVSIPVVSCPTTFGVATPTSAPLPTSEKVRVPGALAGELALYSDTHGLMDLLGPKGWRCRADYGADGSGGVVVYPDGETIPRSWGAGWKLPSNSSAEAIAGLQTGGSPVEAAGQACPLFTSAATAYQVDLGQACPVSRPVSESVQRISAGVVGFEDPVGVAGDGIPSGGRDPADGVMTYSPSRSPGSYLATCTLPSSQHALCTVSLNDFIVLYGQT
ncbi:MAG TPA: hypothetical protein VN816_08265 [Acidimicrobiales bacterium]|nr:hypothetical protein [Acidimicrobiales bacterium]